MKMKLNKKLNLFLATTMALGCLACNSKKTSFPPGLENALEATLQESIQKRGTNMLGGGGYPTVKATDGTTYFYGFYSGDIKDIADIKNKLYLNEKGGRVIVSAYKKEHNFQSPKDASILYLFIVDLNFKSKEVDVEEYKIN